MCLGGEGRAPLFYVVLEVLEVMEVPNVLIIVNRDFKWSVLGFESV